MYICVCKAVSEADLCTIIEQTGPNLEKVQHSCGAGTDCGSCESRVLQYIHGQAAGSKEGDKSAS
jgi:bacterioferritin-associated ferredoxin